jgi:hypothetical protein
MGCAVSSIERTSLEVRSPTNSQSDVLEGELVVCCRNRLKLDRDVRVTLKLQATLVTVTGWKDKNKRVPEMIQHKHIIWEVGGVIRKRGTFLEAGENRLEFDFPLQGKLRDINQSIDPEEVVNKFGKCTFIAYEYLLRAGSVQIEEFARSPKLFPPGENGLRIIDAKMMNGVPSMESKLASSLVASLDMANIATILLL